MTPIKKISFLILVLLANLLISSCGCNKKKGNPLIREEKKLKNSLQGQCKPEGWKKLEETFEQNRNSPEKIKQHMQKLLAVQEQISNFVKLIPTIVTNPPSQDKQPELQALLDFLSPLKQCPEDLAKVLQKNYPSSLQNLISLATPEVLQVISSFLNNQLELWRNLQKQLDAKSTEGEGSDSNEP
jgi:plasmid maintenance system antidote protein VapI